MSKRRRELERRRAATTAAARRRTRGPHTARAANGAPGGQRSRMTIMATSVAVIGVLALLFVGGFMLGGLGSSVTSPSASTGGDEPTATAQIDGSHLPTPTTGGIAPVISGVACDVDEGTAYHVHAHLNIRIDGRLFLPPADVGILPICLYWLHTHQGQGVIHIEAPTELAFTLGQFFDVWGETLSSTQVLDAAVGPGRSMFIFIDGQPFEGDPRAIELRNLESIEIQVGPDPLEPLPYTFPPDLL